MCSMDKLLLYNRSHPFLSKTDFVLFLAIMWLGIAVIWVVSVVLPVWYHVTVMVRLNTMVFCYRPILYDFECGLFIQKFESELYML